MSARAYMSAIGSAHACHRICSAHAHARLRQTLRRCSMLARSLAFGVRSRQLCADVEMVDEEAVILTDILGLEDGFGTMDFKVFAAIALRAPYALPGTDAVYGARWPATRRVSRRSR
eukprot:2210062-Rhodomonas_salina.5